MKVEEAKLRSIELVSQMIACYELRTENNDKTFIMWGEILARGLMKAWRDGELAERKRWEK